MKLGVLVESEEGLDWPRWRRRTSPPSGSGSTRCGCPTTCESPWSPESAWIGSVVALAVAAAETRRIRLGTLVSPITFRQPAIVARMAEAIDALAPGRFVLGLGLGWNADEHAAHGLAFPSVARAHGACWLEGMERDSP